MQYIVLSVVALVLGATLCIGYNKFFGGEEISAKEQEMQQMLERSRR